MLSLLSSVALGDVGGIDVDEAMRRMNQYNGSWSGQELMRKDADDRLPQLGIAGSSVITVEEERVFGNYFFRKSKQHLNVILDPVLDDYIKTLGNRLISHANNVHFPFNFFLVENQEINAAAFLGGNVRIHSGLLTFADNESQLASVIAHEITHVTQRHIARFIEDSASRQNLAIGAIVGGIILSIINPSLGMAALHTSLGLNIQASINYTRRDESEADNIGIDLMARSGFDPREMGEMFSKMTSLSYKNIPQGLLTHPIPETRIAEARSRAERYPAIHTLENINFLFARARIQARYSGLNPEKAIEFFMDTLKGHRGSYTGDALYYGLSLAYLDNKNYAQALEYYNKIDARFRSNPFMLDVYSDICILGKNPQAAINALSREYQLTPNSPTVVINLAMAQNAAGQYRNTIKILKQFLYRNPDYDLAHDLLARTYRKINDMYNFHVELAAYFSLSANYDKSNFNLLQATKYAKSKLEKARLDALTVKNEQLRVSDAQFEK